MPQQPAEALLAGDLARVRLPGGARPRQVWPCGRPEPQRPVRPLGDVVVSVLAHEVVQVVCELRHYPGP